MSGDDKCCALCGLRVYGLWVDAEPHPVGCTDGLDATPWLCAHVLGSLALAVVRIDYLDGTLAPHHEQIISVIGRERADAIFAHVRQHRRPPKAGNRRDPDYSRPSMN